MGTKGQKLVVVPAIPFIAQNFKHSKIRFFRPGMFHQPTNTSFTADNLLSL